MPLIARPVSLAEARRIWIAAQRLNEREPFGEGPDATRRAIEHLGYVQIDTINVIERSHHHILYSRIPSYSRADLHRCQTIDKTVFEYWTHALAYVPVRDLRYFMGEMKEFRRNPMKWFGEVADADVNRMIRVIRQRGAISIRDVDDEPVEKTWSRPMNSLTGTLPGRRAQRLQQTGRSSFTCSSVRCDRRAL